MHKNFDKKKYGSWSFSRSFLVKENWNLYLFKYYEICNCYRFDVDAKMCINSISISTNILNKIIIFILFNVCALTTHIKKTYQTGWYANHIYNNKFPSFCKSVFCTLRFNKHVNSVPSVLSDTINIIPLM